MTQGLSESLVWDKLPWFQGGTAWGLMEAVIQVVRQEPLRLDMGSTVRGPGHRWTGDGRVVPEKGPVCGTIGCCAGWMHVLTAATKDEVLKVDPIGRALDLLPVSVRPDAISLFYGRDEYQFPDLGVAREGTKRYAAWVVKNIERFMRRHEQALKRHKIEGRRRKDWAPFEQWAGKQRWMRAHGHAR